jgi:hypothetical protein
MRQIIDIPRVFLRNSAVNWQIESAGQSSGQDTGGGDQVVVTGFPRFIGTVPLVLPPDMIPHFRALIAKVDGRINAIRLAMIDPLVRPLGAGAWQGQWQAYLAGVYEEPSPKVTAVAASAAGASAITIDERPLSLPVRIGAILSYSDRPFIVIGRAGPAEARILSVKRLSVPIPVDGQIDLIGRGVFLLTDPLAGNPAYDLMRVSRPELPLSEWITRP